jgi:ubiquitin-conjugating enzyme E2 R
MDTKVDAEKDGVCVPMTLQDYCVSSRRRLEQQPSMEFDYCDDYSVDADDSDSETLATCSTSDFQKGESHDYGAGTS